MTVSDQIIQVLDALCAKFGLAIDWTSENVIPYLTTLCTKLVTWEIWSSVAWIGIMAVLTIVSIIFVAKCRIFTSDFVSDWDILAIFLICGFLALWVGAAICIGIQIFDIIKCNTFPEMFVFEYIQNAINAGK